MEVKTQLFILWVSVLLRTVSGLKNAIFVRKSFNSTTSSKVLKGFGFEGTHIVNTIQDAQKLLRNMRKDSDRFVYLESGKHYFYDKDAFVLNPILDSGSRESRIVYSTFKTSDTVEDAQLIGGKELPSNKFKLFESRGKVKVYSIDLFSCKLGLNESVLGSLANPYPVNIAELFYTSDDTTYQALIHARHPNLPNNDIYNPWTWVGYEDIVSVNINESYFDLNDTVSGHLLMSALQASDEAWIHGYFKFDWRDTYVRISGAKQLDNTTFRIYMDTKTPPQYPPIRGFRFYMLNSIAFLDRPGEYYINRKNGTLYVALPSNVGNIKSVSWILSTLDTIVSSTSDSTTALQYLSFVNMTMAISKGNGIYLKNADNVTIEGCTVSNTVGACISFQGENSIISNTTIYGCGTYGIDITGGNIETLNGSYLHVVQNKISNFSRLIRTYRPGVGFNCVGCYIANNSIHRAPHTAIQGGGNNNVFEYNSILEASYECTDTGSFYIGRSWSQRGNIVRFNTFNKVRPLEKLAQKSCSQNAFYLDDQMSGWEFYGNTIINSTTGVLLGGGRRNHIHDNFFLNNDKDIAFDNRGMTWQHSACLINCTGPVCFHAELENLNYQNPPYSTEYPEIARIYDNYPCIPVDNVIEDNKYCHELSPSSAVFIDRDLKTINSWHSSISNNVEDCNIGRRSQILPGQAK